MTEKSPTPPGRANTQGHSINPASGQRLNTAAKTTVTGKMERGLVASSGWAEAAQIVADPAAAAAIAGASASVAKAVIREAGATIRQGMAEKTNRKAGAPSAGPAGTSSDGQA